MYLVPAVQCISKRIAYPQQRSQTSRQCQPSQPNSIRLHQGSSGPRQLEQRHAGRHRVYCTAAPWPVQASVSCSNSQAPAATASASQIMAYIMPLPGLPPATPAQLAGASGGAYFQLVPSRPSLTLPPAPRQAGGPAGGTPPALRRPPGPVAHRRVVLPVALRHLAAWLPRNGATGLVLVRRTPAPLPAPHSSATNAPPSVLVEPRQPAGAAMAVVPIQGPAAAPAARRHGAPQEWPVLARHLDHPAPKATTCPTPASASRPNLAPWLTQPSSHAATSGRRLPRRTWAASGPSVKAGLALAAGAAALLLSGGGQPTGEGETAVPMPAPTPVQPLGVPAAGLGSSAGAPVAAAAAAAAAATGGAAGGEAGYTAWQVGRLSEALAGYQAEARLLRAEEAALVALAQRGGGNAPAPSATPGATSSTSDPAQAGPTAAGEPSTQAGSRWGWLRGRGTSSSPAPLAAGGGAAATAAGGRVSVAARLEAVRGELASLEVLCEALRAEISRTQRGDNPPPPSQV